MVFMAGDGPVRLEHYIKHYFDLSIQDIIGNVKCVTVKYLQRIN